MRRYLGSIVLVVLIAWAHPWGGRCSTWPGPDTRDVGLAGMLQHVVRTEFARIRSSRGAPYSDPSAVFREEGVPGTRIFGGRTRWKALAGLMFVLPSIRAISFAGPPSSLRFTAFPKARHSLTRTGPSTGSLFPKILTFPVPLPPGKLQMDPNTEHPGKTGFVQIRS